jgi:hypothetical protein
MLAAVAGKEDMGVMLAKRFPESIALQNASGLDAVCCSAHFFSLTLSHIDPFQPF